MAGAAYTRSHSSAPWKRASGIQFTMWDPDSIKAGSVCEITESTSHVEGVPQPNSCHDLRLGITEFDQMCHTCNMGLDECPGHWGNITLAKPMLHFGYLRTMVNLLKCVCFHCSLIKLDPDDPKYREAASKRLPEHRLRMFTKACAGKSVCEAKHGSDDVDECRGPMSGCGKPQPKIYHEPHSFNLWIEYVSQSVDAEGADRKQRLQPEDARKILCKIRDSQLHDLGFSPQSRPEWMLLTEFPISPPAVRPAITMDAVTKTEDHTTYMYNKILIYNNKLKKAVSQQAADSVIQDYSNLVQYHIVTLMDNEKNGIPKCKVRSGQPIKSIRERIKGKGGRVRSNLMGKRVDFSARTVIGGDSQIGMDEVGVPLSIAANMTFPERVTSYNQDILKVLVGNGPDKYPGAKFIIREDGTRINLAFRRKDSELILQPGYIVERHVLTNDVVLFNRQPTLHRMSMMGHRARVMPFCTFRLNLSATSPYNADFDGDEMNLHVPQSVLSKSELQEFMMVPKNIISPKSNSPVMGIVQDSLLGIHLLTKRSTFLDKQFMMNAVMHIPTMPAQIPIPAILKPELLWTGKQLFSLVLPPVNFTATSNEDYDDPDRFLPIADTKVRIEKGLLHTGIIDKKSVGSSENSLVHVIHNEFSPDWARDLINGIQRITAFYLINKGFSVGVQDTVADVNTKKMIQEIIRRSYDSVDELCNKAQEGLKRQPGKTVKETFEAEINKILNKTREDAGKRAQQSLTRSNSFKVMVSAGSKGSYLNISQITAVVGQQNVGGKRIPYGFRKRTLPHFTQDDYGPESRGFVQNSYLEGLTPSEFFFHMSGGREGLIDTACKTAETGYIQRKLVKALEDLYVGYDATVRDAQGRVVQFLYGEEGYDSTKMESLRPLPLVNLDNAARDKLYKHTWEEEGPEWGRKFLEPGVREMLLQDPNAATKLQEEYDHIRENREWMRSIFQPAGLMPFVQPMDGIKVPINLVRLLDNAKINFDIKSEGLSDLSPLQVIEGLDQLKRDMIVCRGFNSIHEERQYNGTRLWNVVLQSFFSSKRVICEYRLNVKAFEWLLGEVRQRYNSAQIPPGEMVGCIAAQSMGEPATQMTLNTFHFAGVASKNVTLGVPRLKELINVVKKPKNQGLVVHLAKGLRDSKDEAKRVQTVVEYLTLRGITNKTEIWYDPHPDNSVIEEDRQWLNVIDWDFGCMDEKREQQVRQLMKRMSPWILRLELNQRSFFSFDLDMEEIERRLSAVFPDSFNVEVSTANRDSLVVRLRFIHQNARPETYSEEDMWETPEENSVDMLKDEENDILDKVHLRGILGIKKVYMRKTRKQDNDLRVEYDPVTGAAETKEEWVLDTDGTNMLRVMSLAEVDPYRTSSNNITEIITTLGIEACRKKLKKELANVYGAYGIYINARHSSILCDVMCNRGYLLSINRHGINRQEVGPLMRCSYEETVEILLGAAAFGEKDEMTGVSANIMMGQQCRAGTGLCSLILDEEKLKMTDVLPSETIHQQKQLAEVNLNLEGHQTPAYNDGGMSPGSAMASSVMSMGSGSGYGGSILASPLSFSGSAINEGWSPQVSIQARSPSIGMGLPSPGGSAGAGSSMTPMSGVGDAFRSPAYGPTSSATGGFAPSPGFSPSAGFGSGSVYNSTAFSQAGTDGQTPSVYNAPSPFYSEQSGGGSPSIASQYSANSPSVGGSASYSPSAMSSRGGSPGLSPYSPKASYAESVAYSPGTQAPYSPSVGQSAATYAPRSPGPSMATGSGGGSSFTGGSGSLSVGQSMLSGGTRSSQLVTGQTDSFSPSPEREDSEARTTRATLPALAGVNEQELIDEEPVDRDDKIGGDFEYAEDDDDDEPDN